MTQSQKNTPDDGQGDTRPQQQETRDRSVPRTPNERDTSADSQSGGQPGSSAQTDAAASDAASGRPDTGKAPEMDRVYNEQVRDGSPKGGVERQ